MYTWFGVSPTGHIRRLSGRSAGAAAEWPGTPTAGDNGFFQPRGLKMANKNLDRSSPPQRSLAWAWLVLLLVVVLAGGGLYYYLRSEAPPPQPVASETTTTTAPDTAAATAKTDSSGITEQRLDDSKVIELAPDKQDKATAEKMAQRKEQLGLKKGVQGVVTEEETIKVGQNKVPMSRIAAKIRSSRHQVKEESLDGAGPQTNKASILYGVRVVKPGDNLWNIHFNVLREYFAKRGIKLTRKSDEPNARGVSSGIGRILKYAERMVFIYSCRTDTLCQNLNVIHPNDKVVIFNMTEIENVLAKLGKEHIKDVHFDGTNLYAP